MFFVTCTAVEPFPSSKIDIAQAFIRRDLKTIMSGKLPDDLVMEWNKEPVVIKTLSIEEQAENAIKMLNAMTMATGTLPDNEREDAIRRIREKCQRLQSENLEQ